MRGTRSTNYDELAEISAFLTARFSATGFLLLAETEYSDAQEDLIWGDFRRTDGNFSIFNNELINPKNQMRISIECAKQTIEYKQKLEVMRDYKVNVEFQLPQLFSLTPVEESPVWLQARARCESIKKPSWDSLAAFFSVVDCRVFAANIKRQSDSIDLSKIEKVLKDLNELNLRHRTSSLGTGDGLATDEFTCASYGYAMNLLGDRQLAEIYRCASDKNAEASPRTLVRSLLTDVMHLSPNLNNGDERRQFLSSLLFT